MQVKRFADAKPYEAPNHRGCLPLRLFGAEAGGTQTLIVGISHFLPGGGAGPDASPPEKVKNGSQSRFRTMLTLKATKR